MLPFASLYAQIDDSKKIKSLEEQIADNKQKFYTDADNAFKNTEELLKHAINSKDQEAEMKLLDQRCWYFFNSKMDLNSTIREARLLEKKALAYRSVIYQANAHDYLSGAYAYNGLFEKAMEENSQAMKLLSDADIDENLRTGSRIRFLTSKANIYARQEDNRNSAKALIDINTEIDKLNDKERKRWLSFINYSNLAKTYVTLNPDSAGIFARKSNSLKKPDEEGYIYQLANFLVLGEAARLNADYEDAIKNYKKAESFFAYTEVIPVDQEIIFRGLAEVYAELDSTQQAQWYAQKLNGSYLEQELHKNKSLHTIIEEKMLEDRTTLIYTYIGFSLLVVALVLGLIYFRKKSNKLLEEQEKASQHYLEGAKQISLPETKDYSKLVNMVKNGDPAFMAAFNETFPEFTEKIRSINPRIVQTELEFCAFLKLNLPTNEIAIYKNIEKRTVQVKKYRIRKKMNISEDMDIYMWFSQL